MRISETVAADQRPTTLAAKLSGHHLARVVSTDDDGATATVLVDGETLLAQVAVGCLVRPAADDLVLVYGGSDRAYVLNVLERAGSNWAAIGLPGRGNMSIEGETIAIAVRQRISLRADNIDLQTKLFTVLADKATWLGKLYTLIAERFRSSLRSQEISADTLTVKAVERIAIVDGVDSLQANTQVVKISGVASETAHSKVISVTDDLRLDGKRVTVA